MWPGAMRGPRKLGTTEVQAPPQPPTLTPVPSRRLLPQPQMPMWSQAGMDMWSQGGLYAPDGSVPVSVLCALGTYSCLTAGGLLYALHIPERFAPSGKFDIWVSGWDGKGLGSVLGLGLRGSDSMAVHLNRAWTRHIALQLETCVSSPPLPSPRGLTRTLSYLCLLLAVRQPRPDARGHQRGAPLRVALPPAHVPPPLLPPLRLGLPAQPQPQPQPRGNLPTPLMSFQPHECDSEIPCGVPAVRPVP